MNLSGLFIRRPVATTTLMAALVIFGLFAYRSLPVAELPNVDFPTSYIYYLMGLPIEIYTPIFALARIAGWTSHMIEQLDNNRLIRPASEYVGPLGLTFTPIDER